MRKSFVKNFFREILKNLTDFWFTLKFSTHSEYAKKVGSKFCVYVTMNGMKTETVAVMAKKYGPNRLNFQSGYKISGAIMNICVSAEI